MLREYYSRSWDSLQVWLRLMFRLFDFMNQTDKNIVTDAKILRYEAGCVKGELGGGAKSTVLESGGEERKKKRKERK